MNKVKSLIKWAGRLLALATGTLLVLAAALAVFDDEDYRDALVWAAQRYFDVTLTIDGPFSIELGPTLALHAQGLRLQTNDGHVSAFVTNLGTQLQLRPLLSEAIWLDSLTIAGARIDIHHSPDEWDVGRDDGPQGLPKIILRETRLLDVILAYHDADDAVQEVRVDQLLIEEAPDQGLVTVGGNGEINGQQIELTGTLGSREQLLDTATPFPLDLHLNSGALSFALVGTIADPIEGHGVDLKTTADDPDLAASLALFGEQVPSLGAMRLEGKIGGDYDVLSIEQMKLSLRRGEQINVNVEGSIGNIQAISGLKLEFSGAVDDAAVWRWLTAGKFPDIGRGTVRGSLGDQSGVLRVSDLEVEAESKTGVILGMKGKASIDPNTTPLTEPDIDLALSLAAPSLTAIKALMDHDVPELGPVQLSTHVSGRPPLLKFEALDATVGKENQHRFTVKNGHGQLDLQKEPRLQKARIPMTATTPRPAGLARLFGVDTPKLGRTTAKGIWSVDGSTIKLEQIDSTIQLPGDATHRFAGTVVHRIGRSTTADIRFDLDTDRVLALWTENTPGELGRITGTIDLLREKDNWQARRLELDSIKTDLFKLNVTGKTGARPVNDPQEMVFRLQIDDPQRLLVTAGLTPLALPPIYAGGSLIAHQGQYQYRGDLVAGESATQVNLTGSYQGDRPEVSGEIKTPLLVLADIGLSVESTEALEASKDKATPDSEEHKDGKPKTLFSREPLDLAWLQKLDLDISIQVDELRGVNLEIDEANGQITLEAGRLRLSQADFRYLGGTASGYYEIDARATPVYKVDVKVDDLALGDLLAEFLPNTIKGGIMDLELKLEGRGQTAHQVASSLSGAMDVAFEKSKIPSTYVEFLSADVLGWTLGKTAFSDGYSHIDCGVIGIDIESGVAQSHVLLADGPNFSLSGNAGLDLGAETLELVLLPDQKGDIFINATPVKLSGSVLDPTIETIPARAATKRVGRMVLLPQVFVPLEVLTRGWRLLGRRGGSSPGCSKVLGRSVEEGFAFEGAKPQSARQN